MTQLSPQILDSSFKEIRKQKFYVLRQAIQGLVHSSLILKLGTPPQKKAPNTLLSAREGTRKCAMLCSKGEDCDHYLARTQQGRVRRCAKGVG